MGRERLTGEGKCRKEEWGLVLRHSGGPHATGCAALRLVHSGRKPLPSAHTQEHLTASIRVLESRLRGNSSEWFGTRERLQSPTYRYLGGLIQAMGSVSDNR